MKRAILYFFISACVLSTKAQVQKATTGSSELSPVDSYHYTEVQNGESMVIVRESNPQERQTVLASKASNLSVYKTAEVTAGNLRTTLTTDELTTVTNLTIIGTLDATDFKTMSKSMPQLSEVDLSGIDISAYTGTDGTIAGINTVYPANEIPMYAFGSNTSTSGISNLTKIVLPESTTSIGGYAFQYCTVLNTLKIVPTVVSIKNSAFICCLSLTSFFIPSSVISIESNVFLGDNCTITVDAGNTKYSSLDGILFNKDQTILVKYPTNKVGAYSIPSTVTNISNLAFIGCSNLTSVDIPTSVQTIGTQAFSYCKGLSSVFIPASVTSLNYWVFLSSPSLITVDTNNPAYSSADGVLFDKNKLTLWQCPISKTGEYTIPSTVTYAFTYSFRDCIGLTTINIPSSLKQIGSSAFQNCSGLNTLSIPETVSIIGTSAFYNCSGLKSVFAFSTTPINLGPVSSVFYNVDKNNCTLYVPMNSKSLYQASTEWSDFTNIEEMTTGLKNETTVPVNVYPNPVTDGFRLHGFVGSCQLMLSDVSGKTVFSKRVNADEFVSIDMLPKGVYTAKLTNQDGTVERKVMKK